MVDEEEGSGVQTDSGNSEIVEIPDKVEMDQAEAKEWYDGTTGEGVEQDTLSTYGERPTEDEVGYGEMMIASSEKDRRFPARLLETLDIGEVNVGKAYAIKEEIASTHHIEESVTMC